MRCCRGVNQAMPRALVFPGRGETVAELRALVPSQDVRGIDFDERFAALGFAAQLAKVSACIARDGSSTTLLVGRSFGAWLLLHALLQREQPYPGTVLLLAPVLGQGSVGQAAFLPARTQTFWTRVQGGAAMPATRMVLMCGTEDRQAPLALAQRLATHWPVTLHEVALDHALPAWQQDDVPALTHAALRV